MVSGHGLRSIPPHRWSAIADREFLCVLPETAQHYGIEARSYTYARGREEDRSTWPSATQRRGCSTGHRVGLMLENRPAMFFHWLASEFPGGVGGAVNTDWREAELEYVIGHSEMVAAWCAA